jgi:hypothetical protein
MCEWCGAYPAIHLGPEESGPTFGLELEGETDDYCSQECRENEIQFNRKMADPKA